jgi:hypothetical protein
MPMSDDGLSGVTLAARQPPRDFIKISSLLTMYSEPVVAVQTTGRQERGDFHHTTGTLGLGELTQLILYSRAQECSLHCHSSLLQASLF